MAPALDKAIHYPDTADVYDLSLLGCDNWLTCAINVIGTRRWFRDSIILAIVQLSIDERLLILRYRGRSFKVGSDLDFIIVAAFIE